MKSKTLTCITAITLLATLALPAQLAAQHTRYKLIDLGTLGGPASYESVNGEGNQILNNSGVIASSADTSIPDPTAPDFCYTPNCFVTHAIRWKNGTLTDLGALLANYGSAAGAINARGWITGQSQNGVIDPVTGLPETRAVLWKENEIIDLGTLGGNESLGIYVNDGGQVIGMATINTDPDPSFLGAPTHTFIWKDGEKVDLGTLGGPDAFVSVGCVNQRQGLVVGGSLTSSIPDPIAGVPPQDPFLWENGTMLDLGTLGGTFGYAQCANNRGQVIGVSSLAENPFACFPPEQPGPGCHPFLWEHGVLTDLGTLGGDKGTPIWINDAGDVVGEADLPGSQTSHAFLWRKGVMIDLGTLDGPSHATAINSRGQIVGYFRLSDRTEPPKRHPFIWEKDGPMLDLNTLIPANSDLELVTAVNINERGEIVGVGVTGRCFPDFCGHLFLLIPCAASDTQECEDNGEGTNAAVQSNPVPAINSSTTPSPQRRPTPWRHGARKWRSGIAFRASTRQGISCRRLDFYSVDATRRSHS